MSTPLAVSFLFAYWIFVSITHASKIPSDPLLPDHGVIGYINYYSSTNITGPLVSVPRIIVIDRWALVVFTILFFAYQVGTLIWMYLVPWKRRRMMFRKDNQIRLQLVSTYNGSGKTFMDYLRGTRSVHETANTSTASHADHWVDLIIVKDYCVNYHRTNEEVLFPALTSSRSDQERNRCYSALLNVWWCSLLENKTLSFQDIIRKTKSPSTE